MLKKQAEKITELSVKIVELNPKLNPKELHAELSNLGYDIEHKTAAQLYYHAKDSVSQSFYKK
tara:strand:- start:160 stop:348 length:189 start_codon:yes stop_codon:yes gene_type:complete